MEFPAPARNLKSRQPLSFIAAKSTLKINWNSIVNANYFWDILYLFGTRRRAEREVIWRALTRPNKKGSSPYPRGLCMNIFVGNVVVHCSTYFSLRIALVYCHRVSKYFTGLRFQFVSSVHIWIEEVKRAVELSIKFSANWNANFGSLNAKVEPLANSPWPIYCH